MRFGRTPSRSLRTGQREKRECRGFHQVHRTTQRATARCAYRRGICRRIHCQQKRRSVSQYRREAQRLHGESKSHTRQVKARCRLLPHWSSQHECSAPTRRSRIPSHQPQRRNHRMAKCWHGSSDQPDISRCQHLQGWCLHRRCFQDEERKGSEILLPGACQHPHRL